MTRKGTRTKNAAAKKTVTNTVKKVMPISEPIVEETAITLEEAIVEGTPVETPQVEAVSEEVVEETNPVSDVLAEGKVVAEKVAEKAEKAAGKAVKAVKTTAAKAKAAKEAKETKAVKTEKKSENITIVEFFNKQFDITDIDERIKADWVAKGHRASSIKSVKTYIKPEDYAVYYVINGKEAGKIWL